MTPYLYLYQRQFQDEIATDLYWCVVSGGKKACEPVRSQSYGSLVRFGSHTLIFFDALLSVSLQSHACYDGLCRWPIGSAGFWFQVCHLHLDRRAFTLFAELSLGPLSSLGIGWLRSRHVVVLLESSGKSDLKQGSLDSLSSLQGPSNVRNYWWSRPTTSEATNTTVPSSQHTSEPAAQTNTATSPAAPEETVVSTDAPQYVAQTETIPTSESISAVLPINVSALATDVIPPLQYGDLAALGITSWWPSGIMSWSFELLQVSTGMPWFYTIIAGTLFWRAALIPTALTSMRNAARLRPYSDQIKTLDEQAQGVKDRAAQMEIMLKKQKLMEKAGVSLRSMFLPPVIQMIGNFGLFFAVRNMVQLPVIQLTQSGVWFLPDLTLTGDYVMPTLVLLAMNVQFAVSVPPSLG